MIAWLATGGSGGSKGLMALMGTWGGVFYFCAFCASLAHVVIDYVRGRRGQARKEWRAIEEEHRIHLRTADKRKR